MGKVVAVAEEGGLTAIAALGDVVGVPGNDHASEPRHAPMVVPTSSGVSEFRMLSAQLWDCGTRKGGSFTWREGACGSNGAYLQ